MYLIPAARAAWTKLGATVQLVPIPRRVTFAPVFPKMIEGTSSAAKSVSGRNAAAAPAAAAEVLRNCLRFPPPQGVSLMEGVAFRGCEDDPPSRVWEGALFCNDGALAVNNKHSAPSAKRCRPKARMASRKHHGISTYDRDLATRRVRRSAERDRRRIGPRNGDVRAGWNSEDFAKPAKSSTPPPFFGPDRPFPRRTWRRSRVPIAGGFPNTPEQTRQRLGEADVCAESLRPVRQSGRMIRAAGAIEGDGSSRPRAKCLRTRRRHEFRGTKACFSGTKAPAARCHQSAFRGNDNAHQLPRKPAVRQAAREQRRNGNRPCEHTGDRDPSRGQGKFPSTYFSREAPATPTAARSRRCPDSVSCRLR